ncbi:MAG TPA: metallophosphoesterase, partial [Xanthobacteraceae bacterium]|nr:metallophosphoesterase [Xanthobacteraceae bacterium]
MFVLAHLSDPHIPPLPDCSPFELIGKRITGYMNWRLRRGAHHSRAVLDALTQDMRAHEPDHIVVTGDLANLSLAPEFATGREFLQSLGEARHVSVIPGNHDAYVRGADRNYLDAWREYLTGDTPRDFSFPYLRRRGPIALIGVSTAVPTLPFFASGRIGSAQMDRFAAMMEELPREQCF